MALETELTTRDQNNNMEYIETTDKVFLLSEADLNGMFGLTEAAQPEDYTYGTSKLVTNDNMIKCTTVNADFCWLRSPTKDTAFLKASDNRDATPLDSNMYSQFDLRPALWFNLSK